MPSHVVILYGTHEGQTRKIATFIADRLKHKGVSSTLIDAADLDPDASLPAFDAAIVAASLHAGGFQKSVTRVVAKHVASVSAKPNVFISVSLSAAGEDEEDWRGLEQCLDEFFSQAGWRPQRVEHVAGAFRYTQYDFFKRMIMKRIAKERGAPIDTSRDWEMTDWDKLGAFIDAFASEVTKS